MPAPESLPPVRALLDAAVAAVGGSPRAGQQAMAEAVAEAFRTGEHLLVQAGTGTGKSLAYLAPAIRAAADGDGPVLLATATLALQSQLFHRDLPVVADAVAPLLGRRPTFAVLKGRANYVCRHRMFLGGLPEDSAAGDAAAPLVTLFGEEVPQGASGAAAGAGTRGSRGLKAPPDGARLSALEADVARVRRWAEESRTGDRDDLRPGVSDTVWRAVSVTARQCIGATRCPVGTECFAERARARARDVDVVVTNHAMLALDVLTDAQLLPEHTVLIVDEGHELVDRATSAATESLVAGAVQRLAARFRRTAGTAGPVGPAGGSGAGGPGDAGDVVETAAEALEGAAESLAALAAGLPPGRMDAWDEAVAAGLAAVRDGASRALAACGGDGREGEHAAALRELRVLLTEARDTATRLLACSPHDVRWSSTDPRGAHAFQVAPLSVAGLLREALFGERTVVVTSATLSLGGSFDIPARNLGLPRAPADEDDGPRWRGLDVGSPFDYPRQGILYVARHLPQPGRDGPSEQLLHEMIELVTAAGGRTLGLFSSSRAAREAAAAARDAVPFPVLCQGDATTAELVRQFAADPATCLFGTLSLWQGIDVPGSSCSLVTVDRIPFPRPDDPIASARREARDRGGGSGFRDVYVASAALLLAQGVGRLIRSTEDRGVVAVLDPRLATAAYGPFLRSSLPPFWWTTDAGVVRRSLTNLRDRA